MKSQQQKKEGIAANSVGASFLLTMMKLVVGLMTNSMGILSEAAHSLLDMGAAVITWFAVRTSDKPADEEHHYGHGKVEAISALAETVLLFITSIWIIYEATKRLIHGNIEVEATWYAFAVVLISIGVDYSRSRALMKVAKETKSQALEADALHFRSDIWSSSVVLVGLICLLFGIKGADSIAALGVALFVLKVGWHLGKRTFDVLIDTAPEGIAEIAKDILKEVPGVIEVERVRARAMGPTESIDAVIHVSRKLNGEIIRSIAEKCETALREKLPGADVLIHSKAVQLSSETIIETIHVLANREGFSVHDVIVDTADGKKYISYDLEVSEHLSVGEAHNIATSLEMEILRETGEDAEINTHIDPSKTDTVESSEVSKGEMETITKEVIKAASEIRELHNPHNILARKAGGHIIVSVHCNVQKDMLVEEAHEYSKRLEHIILTKNRSISRAVVHVEPE